MNYSEAKTLTSSRHRLVQILSSYWQMTKPTISLLVVFTVMPGLVMASQTLPSFSLCVTVLLGTFLASASASMFNHVIDAEIDRAMERTETRPLASGHAQEVIAIVLASCLGLASFGLLYVLVNPLTAWIGVGANFFYVVIYTLLLKKRTVQNIVIGGAAGAVGPLMGWAAVANSLSWEAWVMFLIIFMWTPPHFWALAIKYKDDYAKANIPMLPSIRGVSVTVNHILVYTVLLVPICASLYMWGEAGWLYLFVSMGCSLYFVWLAWRLFRVQDVAKSMKVFLFSLLYVFAIFGALTVEQVIARL